MSSFDCWQSKEHPMLLDYRTYFPTFCLKSVYECFNEFILCKKLFLNQEEIKLLDVGCASGEVSRYFRHAYPMVDYTGCDISAVAIKRAKQKYPQGNFVLTDFSLSQVKNHQSDYLFCRDVVLHQEDPFGFLKTLSNIPQKGMILRLRTRDQGATVLDVERSCQLNYNQWAPYIILNIDEIISFFKGLGICSKIHIIKNYMILGGQHARFLPKECYLKETKTAETAVYVEFNKEGHKDTEVITEVYKENSEPLFFCRLARYAIKVFIREFQGKVWW